MVVRINQLGVSATPDAAGWPVHDLAGPIKFQWPKEIQLYEVLILEQDEDRRRLQDAFRQQQLRTLIPVAVEALLEENEQLVVRLDGVLAKSELAPALNQIIGSSDPTRYAVSDIRKLDEESPAIAASIRVYTSLHLLSTLAADESVGLERTVRLRAFAAPEAMVNPLLDIDSVQDERWNEILPQCGFVLSTTMGLRSLQVLTRRHDAVAVKARLTQRLLRPKPRAVGV
jgi:hypothetical protein